MTAIPIRGVGEIGIVPDLSSYDLPINAWASGRNVRFKNKQITKSPVFKNIAHDFPLDAPVLIVEASDTGETGTIVVVQADGSFTQIVNGTITDPSPVTPMGAITRRPTSTRLGGVVYVNAASDVPVFRSKVADGEFDQIPGWDPDDRAQSLRSYKDFLLALNITKGSDKFPNMIKWSDATGAGVPPANWDVSGPPSLAGENVLNDATGYLIDGVTLGNAFVLYGSRETYVMSFVGLPNIFEFDKLFADLGIFATDCVCEVDGKHYVFGRGGIYVHDGMQKASISDAKVTNFIYGRIDPAKDDRCFVVHNQARSEIMFCYPSIAKIAQWKIADTAGCNEAAVFNYVEGTWSFVDLPGVVGCCLTSLPVSATWEDLGTWVSLDTTWASYEGIAPLMLLFCSTDNTATSFDARVLFFDELYTGLLSNSPNSDLFWSGWVSTSLKDTDEMGGGLGTRKVFKSVAPQCTMQPRSKKLKVSVGTTDSPMGSLSWIGPTDFAPDTMYKCDFRANGRYLAVKLEIPSHANAIISGYDADIEMIAQR